MCRAMSASVKKISSSSSSSSSEGSSSGSNTKASMQARIAEKMAQRDNAENAWMGWICPCGGKNLTMKARCIVCGAVKPLSAHQRGVGQAAAAIERARLPSRSRSKSLCRPKKRSRSHQRHRDHRHHTHRGHRDHGHRGRRAGSKSSSSSSSSGGLVAQEKPEDATDAKREAMQHIQDIREMADGQEKQKAFRKLLREWHPDKNPERVKMATEVFQFLQKAAKMFKC
mmetsp:Transcript_59926/g.140185  ORF Transcript_59926/g.140185 Transcript_59926/m.140185 type:complete len:227 (+) Transcript_59926:29-709(+)